MQEFLDHVSILSTKANEAMQCAEKSDSLRGSERSVCEIREGEITVALDIQWFWRCQEYGMSDKESCRQ